jgi:hypothetical protein
MMIRICFTTGFMLAGTSVTNGQAWDRSNVSQGPQGITDQPSSPRLPADPQTATAIREVLSSVIDDALTQGRLGDLVGQLVAPERQYIGSVSPQDAADLNSALAHFREDYRLRYGQAFEFKPEFLEVYDIEGGWGSHVALAQLPVEVAWPEALWLDRSMWLTNPTPQGPSELVGGPLVVLESEGSRKALSWKIDAPRELTGRQLAGRLKRCVQSMIHEESAWSDDGQEVARETGRKVLEALMDTSAPGQS